MRDCRTSSYPSHPRLRRSDSCTRARAYLCVNDGMRCCLCLQSQNRLAPCWQRSTLWCVHQLLCAHRDAAVLGLMLELQVRSNARSTVPGHPSHAICGSVGAHSKHLDEMHLMSPDSRECNSRSPIECHSRNKGCGSTIRSATVRCRVSRCSMRRSHYYIISRLSSKLQLTRHRTHHPTFHRTLDAIV